MIITNPRKAIIQGDQALLPLGVDAKQGYAIIDVDEVENVQNHYWTLSKKYVQTNVKKLPVTLHHYILGKPPMGMVTDHVNRNKLDNRKSNLRFVTSHINNRNTSLRIDNKSGHRGGVMV